MQYAELLEDVRKRCGIADTGRAERAIASVVSALGAALSGADADALAENLPPAVSARLRNCSGGAELVDAHELYERVAARAGTTPSLAVEETQVVLQVLAETCGYEALTRARKHLPRDVAVLLYPRQTATEPPPRERLVHTPRVVHETLASGRAGSYHPLSEAHADRAQQHSVARTTNPHSDRKLSSARR